MTTTSIAWKVVYARGEVARTGPETRRVSISATWSWSVEYKQGLWVEPIVAGSKLFVFESPSDAARYITSYPSIIEIWECEVRNAVPAPKFVPRAGIRSNWEGFWAGQPATDAVKTPPGTLLCDAVKLTKKVEWMR